MDPGAPSEDPDAAPEFGPSGYLPARAAKRARKIVLRAPLGLQWVIASLAAGVVVLVAGVLWWSRGTEPPPAPWIEVAAIEAVAPAMVVPTALDGADAREGPVLLVAAGGRIRAFADADEVAYCAASNRLEAGDGRVWSLTGRGFGGVPSLVEHPTRVHAGNVYLDPTVTAPAPTPTDDEVEPACN